jgi:hypothetical protein
LIVFNKEILFLSQFRSETLNTPSFIFVIHSQNTTFSTGLHSNAFVTVVTHHGITKVHDILLFLNALLQIYVNHDGKYNSHSIASSMNAESQIYVRVDGNSTDFIVFNEANLFLSHE